MSTSELFTLYRAMKNNGIPMKQMLCWVKSSFTLGRSDFQFQHEPAIYGIDEGKYDGEKQDGDGEYALYSRKGGKWCGARNLSTCWFFEKPRSSKDHPTMKPIGLCAKGILALSEEKDIVFDPFLGSGSTLIACEQTGRICYGSEIDPKYVDVERKRYCKTVYGTEDNWQELTPALEVA